MKRLFRYLMYLLLIFTLYYIFLPPINIASPGFIFFIATIIILISMSEYVFGSFPSFVTNWTITGTVAVLGVLFVISLINGPVFNAQSFSQLIEVEEKDFAEDFEETDINNIPLMDRDTAERLGERQIGGMEEMVSQFVPADSYTQINLNGHPVRVTPLEYASTIRWFNNRHEGIPGYLEVDMINGRVELIETEEGIKYSDSERFGRDVKRHLRKNHLTAIFGDPSFELDDTGHPYYVATMYEYKNFFNVKEPNGVIILDAITGDTKEYSLDETPEWIDRVYSSDLVLKQLNQYGKYKGGFLNSVMGQEGVTETTDGYNYLSQGNDIYLYTGVTSANSDASNIGFYLVNLRTKKADYYPVTSADEHSAMDSAVGSVQQMGYESTFPILINVGDRPYYLSSLKDDSGLVRLHALVDAQNYQDVILGENLDVIFEELNLEHEVQEVEELSDISGQIEDVSEAVVAGDTIYYFMVNGEIYKANINLSDALPFVNEGTNIEGQVDSNNNLEALELLE